MQVDSANATLVLQGLSDLLNVPGQTPIQMQSGELTYVQMRDRVNGMFQQVEGVTSTSQVSLSVVQDFVVQTAPKIPVLENAIESIGARLGSTEGTTEKLLTTADQQLRDITKHMEDSQARIDAGINQLRVEAGTEINKQDAKHQELTQHAKDKFTEMEGANQEVFEAIKWGSRMA